MDKVLELNKKLCRTCLQSIEQEDYERSCDEAYQILVHLKFIKEYEAFPKEFCASCKDRIRIIYEFKLICQQAEEVLAASLKNNSDDTCDNIETFEETKHDHATLEVTTHLCNKCGKSFTSLRGLRQHFKSHSNCKPYKCEKCLKSYQTKQSLCEHQRVAHSDARYIQVCEHCGVGFTTKSAYAVHFKSHFGLNVYPCSECEKTYTRKAYLKEHMKIHTGEIVSKRFVCNFNGCDKAFRTKCSLNIHATHAHSQSRDYICEHCAKRFCSLNNLHGHRKTHFNTGEILCTVCNKCFTNKYALKRHMGKHKMLIVEPNLMISVEK